MIKEVAMTSIYKRSTLALLLLSVSLLMTACADKPGSAGWCETQKAIPKGDWASEDRKSYAKHCLLDSTTIGSDKWCENLDNKPKADWTTQEVAEYGEYCVVKKVGAAAPE
jgi:hypothetical protein